MTKLTFLHAADLHLDSPFIGLHDLPQAIFNRLKESTFKSLHRIIDIAIEEKVDFVIFAGDLYDQEDRSVKAQSKLRKELERLQKANIHVYIIHGNHDHTGGNWIKLTWPENVHVFSDKEVEVKNFQRDGQTLASLYGFSYRQRAVTDKMIQNYQKCKSGIFHIGILHGNLEGQLEHSQYAPFKLSELMEKGFDYWALGHIHKRQILFEDPFIIYPGNIQGRNKKETGEKGCYVVTLTEAKTIADFHDTAEIVWETLEVSIQPFKNIDELLSHLFEIMNQLRASEKGCLLSIILTGTGEMNEHLEDQNVLDDLIAILNEEEEQKRNFVWVTSIKNATAQEYNRDQLKSETTFIGELLHIIDEYDQYDQAFSTLFSHPQARKFISQYTEQELTEIKKEAENILIQEIYREQTN